MKSTFFALAAIATSTFAAPICYDPDVQVAGSNSTVPSTTASSTVIESTASPSADAEEAPAAPAAGQSSSEGPIGYASLNGGTTGGAGGEEISVSSLAELIAAAEVEGPTVITLTGAISESAEQVDLNDDTTLQGTGSASMTGVGLRIKKASNVIVRNIAISKVLADNGDAIGIDASTNVWIDHVDVSGDHSQSDKDLYDGLLDITHGADFVTVSNSFIHNHHKGSLLGHSDSNADEDTGKLHVTFANNYWSDLGSRAPSVRFGTVHIFNNYYEKLAVGGVNTRMGAEVLIESTTFADFAGTTKAVYSQDSDTEGTVTLNDVDLTTGENTAKEGSMTVDYEYTLLGAAAVKAAVVGTAGATLSL